MKNGHQTCASYDPEQLKKVGEAFRISTDALAFALQSVSREEAERHKHLLASILLEVAADGDETPRRMSMIALARMPPLQSGDLPVTAGLAGEIAGSSPKG